MALPANEDTRTKYKSFVNQEGREHIRLTNDTGADLEQREVAVIAGQFVGVADEAIASGAIGSFHVEENISVEFGADMLKTDEDTFATVGAPVFFDPATKKVSDTATVGYYKIGTLIEAKDSDGVIRVEKLRYAVSLLNAVAPGETGWISYQVAADATTAISVDFGVNFTILDAFVASDATNASATITLQDSSDNAITDAIVATPVHTITRVGTIDGITNGYNVIADGVVKFLANGAADRGTVWMLVRGA